MHNQTHRDALYVVLVVVQSQASVLGTSAIAQVVGVVRTQEAYSFHCKPKRLVPLALSPEGSLA